MTILYILLFLCSKGLNVSSFLISSSPLTLHDPTRNCLQSPQQFSCPSVKLATKDDSMDRVSESLIQEPYKWCKWTFAIASLYLFVIPDKTWTKELASKWGGAAGYGIGSYIFHILNERDLDNDNDVDFYKRLQLGLAGFCVFGLLALPGEAAFWPSPSMAILSSLLLTFVKLFGLLVSFEGWKKHLDMRWNNELWYGWLNNLKSLKVSDRKKGLFYRNSLLLIWLGIISNGFQSFFQVRYRNDLGFSMFSLSLRVSAISRLFLISSLLPGLKTAAEADQVKKPMYWKLNWLLSSWALVVGLGQARSYPFTITPSQGVVMLSFSGILFLKGLKGYKQETAVEPSVTDEDENQQGK